MRLRIRPRHLLLGALALPPAVVFAAWVGFFNVGAASGHWAVTEWLLHFAMRSSIRTWAFGVEAPGALPRDALRPAAGHFARGCAWCHGAPGEPATPSAQHMLPPPPDLVGLVGTWTDAELFRIVKYGVRFTGMPAWPAQPRGDEVWAMVAFLRALPGLSPAEYAALVSPPKKDGPLPAGCAGCHGPEGRGGGPTMPILAGQHEPYLRASLAAFSSGHRASGFMALPAADLAADERAAIARRLAALAPPDPATADEQLRAAGEQIAEQGRPADAIPRCLACHGGGAKPAFPSLDGQRPDYIEAQLRLFRDGDRGGGPYAGLMTAAARHLADTDIATLAAYFSSRRSPARTSAPGGR